MIRVFFVLLMLMLVGCNPAEKSIEKGIEAEIDFETLNLEEYVFAGTGTKTMRALNLPEPEDYTIFQKELKREGEKVTYYTISDKRYDSTRRENGEESVYSVTKNHVVLEETRDIWYHSPPTTILENKQRFEDTYWYEIHPTIVNITTPAGEFLDCLAVTMLLEDYPRAKVTYCPGVGAVKDERNDIMVEEDKWFTVEELVDFEYLDLDEEGIEKEIEKIQAQQEAHRVTYKEELEKAEEELQQLLAEEEERKKDLPLLEQESYGDWEVRDGQDVYTTKFFEVIFPKEYSGDLYSAFLPEKGLHNHHFFKPKANGSLLQDTIFEIRQSVQNPAEFTMDSSDGSEMLYIDSSNGLYYYFIYNQFEDGSEELKKHPEYEEIVYQMRRELDQLEVRFK
ncbi:hypothetical protein AB685_08605 [Bacillus sp. LL01]|uniref:hypothetical protein n=1 Tax=Bacillus sp. LL01 TaxID=1665556 RepID=UPI00064D52BB|nr:hypothetical protein [Bacillus sp. LL01]KMJ59113.1 hypothetical protein AB685_08605 [Bacillus sp. LL01]